MTATLTRLDALARLRVGAGERFFGEETERIARLCHRAADRFARGGRLLAVGNGGSATDAMDVVAGFHAPLGGRPSRPAIDRTEDTAILTALANDTSPTTW